MIDLENMSILVVDDIKSMRLTIRKMLRNLSIGKNLRFADNGRTALSSLRERPVDLVIIDWNMPVMNGSEMLEQLREDKRLRDIPVIMVTAESERDIVSEVAEIEIDAYLLKPLTLAALDQKIRNVVQHANNPDEATCHLLKAREMEENRDFQGAIESVRQALELKPQASRILRKMGILHFNINKPEVGEKCLKKATAVNPQDTISRYHLARHYIQKTEFEKAGELVMEILDLSNRYSELAIDLGEKLMKQGSRSMALSMFDKAIGPADKKNAIKERVIDICMAREEYDFSKQLLERMIRDNPSNHEMVFKAAQTFLKMGDTEKAFEYFQNSDDMQKGDISSKIEMAKICFQAGRIFQADDYLSQILRIDPENKEVLALRREL